MRKQQLRKAKKKHTKKYAQQVHSLDRISDKERYGLDITEEQYLRLCSYIKKGHSSYKDGTTTKFLHRRSNSRTVWGILWEGDKQLIAVYDSERKSIATFLPLEWARRKGFVLQQATSAV